MLFYPPHWKKRSVAVSPLCGFYQLLEIKINALLFLFSFGLCLFSLSSFASFRVVYFCFFIPLNMRQISNIAYVFVAYFRISLWSIKQYGPTNIRGSFFHQLTISMHWHWGSAVVSAATVTDASIRWTIVHWMWRYTSSVDIILMTEARWFQMLI